VQYWCMPDELPDVEVDYEDTELGPIYPAEPAEPEEVDIYSDLDLVPPAVQSVILSAPGSAAAVAGQTREGSESEGAQVDRPRRVVEWRSDSHTALNSGSLLSPHTALTPGSVPAPPVLSPAAPKPGRAARHTTLNQGRFSVANRAPNKGQSRVPKAAQTTLRSGLVAALQGRQPNKLANKRKSEWWQRPNVARPRQEFPAPAPAPAPAPVPVQAFGNDAAAPPSVLAVQQAIAFAFRDVIQNVGFAAQYEGGVQPHQFPASGPIQRAPPAAPVQPYPAPIAAFGAVDITADKAETDQLRKAFRADRAKWDTVREQLAAADSVDAFKALLPAALACWIQVSLRAYQRCCHARNLQHTAPLDLQEVHDCEHIQVVQCNPRLLNLRSDALCEEHDQLAAELEALADILADECEQHGNQSAIANKTRAEAKKLEDRIANCEENAQKDKHCADNVRKHNDRVGLNRADPKYCEFASYIRPKHWHKGLCEILESVAKNKKYTS